MCVHPCACMHAAHKASRGMRTRLIVAMVVASLACTQYEMAPVPMAHGAHNLASVPLLQPGAVFDSASSAKLSLKICFLGALLQAAPGDAGD